MMQHGDLQASRKPPSESVSDEWVQPIVTEISTGS